VLERKCNTDIIFNANILQPKVTKLKKSHLLLKDGSAGGLEVLQIPDGVR
jgi:hypothetical protein